MAILEDTLGQAPGDTLGPAVEAKHYSRAGDPMSELAEFQRHFERDPKAAEAVLAQRDAMAMLPRASQSKNSSGKVLSPSRAHLPSYKEDIGKKCSFCSRGSASLFAAGLPEITSLWSQHNENGNKKQTGCFGVCAVGLAGISSVLRYRRGSVFLFKRKTLHEFRKAPDDQERVK